MTEKKEFVGPITGAAATSVLWFLVKSAASGIVGFIVADRFKHYWTRWMGESVDKGDQDVSREEPKQQD